MSDIDEFEIPDKIDAELESCRRMVRLPNADKAAMLERGATALFRVVDKSDPELWHAVIDRLYDIAGNVGFADGSAQTIFDIAIDKAAELPREADPIIQAWEANTPPIANSHNAEQQSA